MLTFTKDQSDWVLDQRRKFNANERRMATQHGLPTNVRGLNVNMLTANASPLPKDAWGVWDKQFVEVQRDVLAVFNDLSSLSMGMPIGKLVHHFAQMSDSGQVNVSLDGQSESKSDSAVISYQGTPVPIIDSTLSLGWRQVAAAQADGVALEPAMAMNHQRKIAEKLEDLTLNGDSKIVVGSSTLYGLRNHPKRATRSAGATLATATGAQWVSEITACIKALQAKNFFTPVTFYLNYSDWFVASTTDMSTAYTNKTILQRLMEIPGVAAIVPASKIPANEIIGVCKRRDVVQILSAMPPTMRPKTRLDPEDPYIFKVMAAAALEIKYDAANQCGVIHSA